MTEDFVGWARPYRKRGKGRSLKFHYFDGTGLSFCEKWNLAPDYQRGQDRDDGNLNCRKCQQRKAAGEKQDVKGKR